MCATFGWKLDKRPCWRTAFKFQILKITSNKTEAFIPFGFTVRSNKLHWKCCVPKGLEHQTELLASSCYLSH